jgi:hypothetical protein
MKVNITEMLIFFDELVPQVTNEELGVYWFRATLTDNLVVSFSFSIYENYANLSIYNSSDVGIASIRMKNCSAVRVLDEKKKCLEIVHDNNQGRCFLSLSGADILNYSE